MSTSQNPHQPTHDGLGCFTSTDPDDTGTSQPPQPQSNTDSTRLNTLFETSPLGFIATDLDTQRKEDLPEVGNMSELDHSTSDDLIIQLVQALAMMGQGVTAPTSLTLPATTTPLTNPSHLWALNAFDGSNPEDL